MFVLDNRELVDGHEVIRAYVVEVDYFDLRPANGVVLRSVLNSYAIYQHPMQVAIAGNNISTLGSLQAAECVFYGFGWKIRVETSKSVTGDGRRSGLAIGVALSVDLAGNRIAP